MKVQTNWIRRWAAFTVGLCLLAGLAVEAQAHAGQKPDAGDKSSADPNKGPVRLAWFTFVQGNVNWRPDENQPWSPATINMPIREGAQIWVNNPDNQSPDQKAPPSDMAEIQFDDGSVLRVGAFALVTIKTLYSDSEGEFTDITLHDGMATLVARHDHSKYQVDSLVSVKPIGPSRVSVEVDGGVGVLVPRGSVTVDGTQGEQILKKGDSNDLYLENADAKYEIGVAKNADNSEYTDPWETWNDERDKILDKNDNLTTTDLPHNIALVAGDLDASGTWRNGAWYPNVTAPDWRPYSLGRWVYVQPFGWTWVSDESWGWAPYHYGTWFKDTYGWAWKPGQAAQDWSPAVVQFSNYDYNVAWTPLAPSEVSYPKSMPIGYNGGAWTDYYSAGRAAVYYPSGSNTYITRPYNTAALNRPIVIDVTNITYIYNDYNDKSPVGNNRSVPANGTVGTSKVKSFVQHSAIQSVSASEAQDFFVRGKSYMPANSVEPLAGPVRAVPTLKSLTPRASLGSAVMPSSDLLQFSTFRAPLPPNVQHNLSARRNETPETTAEGRDPGPAQGGHPTAPHPGQGSSRPAKRTGRRIPRPHH